MERNMILEETGGIELKNQNTQIYLKSMLKEFITVYKIHTKILYIRKERI